jgi:hypothetical protein
MFLGDFECSNEGLIILCSEYNCAGAEIDEVRFQATDNNSSYRGGSIGVLIKFEFDPFY